VTQATLFSRRRSCACAETLFEHSRNGSRKISGKNWRRRLVADHEPLYPETPYVGQMFEILSLPSLQHRRRPRLLIEHLLR
jgi:hypothetical protein